MCATPTQLVNALHAKKQPNCIVDLIKIDRKKLDEIAAYFLPMEKQMKGRPFFVSRVNHAIFSYDGVVNGNAFSKLDDYTDAFKRLPNFKITCFEYSGTFAFFKNFFFSSLTVTFFLNLTTMNYRARTWENDTCGSISTAMHS